LADEFFPAQRLAIEIDGGQEGVARQVIAGWSAAAAVEWDGLALNVAGVGHAAIPSLIAALVTCGVGVFGVRAEEPTLEDVYFALFPLANNGANGSS
jgi:hypothetical protein